MKIKDSFVLSQIGDSYIVVPTGSDSVDLNGMITLNETGAFLWEKLSEEKSLSELIDEILKEYDIDRETVTADVNEFVEKLRSIGAISE